MQDSSHPFAFLIEFSIDSELVWYAQEVNSINCRTSFLSILRKNPDDEILMSFEGADRNLSLNVIFQMTEEGY